MSIYSSWAAPDEDEHEDDCGMWDKNGDAWSRSDRPCTCGQPDAPLVYQGSHIMPSATDERGGRVDIASIPAHVRYWIDNPNADPATEPTDGWEPFLRFGVNKERVVLTERNVREIVASLTEWLEGLEEVPSSPS